MSDSVLASVVLWDRLRKRVLALHEHLPMSRHTDETSIHFVVRFHNTVGHNRALYAVLDLLDQETGWLEHNLTPSGVDGSREGGP